MHIEGARGNSFDGANDRLADRDVRDEVAIHDVDVDQIGAPALDGRDLAAEIQKVRRQNGWRDLYPVCRPDGAIGHWLTSREIESAGPTRKPPAGRCRTTVPGGTPWYGCEPTMLTRNPRVRSVSEARSPSVPIRSGIT